MIDHMLDEICRATGASRCFEMEMIQSLWSGYGQIVRYGLEGAERPSVVVKHVRLPEETQHPHRFLKGWSPGHWKNHGYSERLAREVTAR